MAKKTKPMPKPAPKPKANPFASKGKKGNC